MDALDFLKKDHDKVKQLFTKLEELSDGTDKNRAQHITSLVKMLDVHAQVEEEIFYPALRKHDELEEMVDEALDEHEQVKQMLDDLQAAVAGISYEDEDEDEEEPLTLREMIDELQDSVEHHVEEEENEIFVQVRELMEEDQLAELGKKMAERHRQLMETTEGSSGSRSSGKAKSQEGQSASGSSTGGKSSGSSKGKSSGSKHQNR